VNEHVLNVGLVFAAEVDMLPIVFIGRLFDWSLDTDISKLTSIERQSGKSSSVEYTWAAISAKLIETLRSSLLPTKLSLELDDAVTLGPVGAAKLIKTLWSNVLPTTGSLTSTAATG
jgi:hypothetical protein